MSHPVCTEELMIHIFLPLFFSLHFTFLSFLFPSSYIYIYIMRNQDIYIYIYINIYIYIYPDFFILLFLLIIVSFFLFIIFSYQFLFIFLFFFLFKHHLLQFLDSFFFFSLEIGVSSLSSFISKISSKWKFPPNLILTHSKLTYLFPYISTSTYINTSIHSYKQYS